MTTKKLARCALLAFGLAMLVGCDSASDLLGGPAAKASARPATAQRFPRAERPIAKVVSNKFSTEAERDNQREAATVMDMAGIGPGQTVADIGAGEGYYTVRLAARVGAKGRVLAQDIDGQALARLGRRVEADRLANVSIKPGQPDDPRLPEASFDRILLVHMYHEISEPYAFLWRLRPALRPGGRVVVVDMDRPTEAHGTPPDLLACEFAALGFRQAQFARKPQIAGYFAEFVTQGERPAPQDIRPCRIVDGKVVRAASQ